MKDRIMLGVAYALLVLVVAWLSWDVDRRLTGLATLECGLAQIAEDQAAISTEIDIITLTAIAKENQDAEQALNDLITTLKEFESSQILSLKDVCGEPVSIDSIPLETEEP